MNPPVFDIENEQESSLLNPAQIVDGMKRHFWIPLTLTFLGLVLGYYPTTSANGPCMRPRALASSAASRAPSSAWTP